jgi:hypothetical protein
MALTLTLTLRRPAADAAAAAAAPAPLARPPTLAHAITHAAISCSLPRLSSLFSMESKVYSTYLQNLNLNVSLIH